MILTSSLKAQEQHGHMRSRMACAAAWDAHAQAQAQALGRVPHRDIRLRIYSALLKSSLKSPALLVRGCEQRRATADRCITHLAFRRALARDKK
jgi:hypothetical protein